MICYEQDCLFVIIFLSLFMLCSYGKMGLPISNESSVYNFFLHVIRKISIHSHPSLLMAFIMPCSKMVFTPSMAFSLRPCKQTARDQSIQHTCSWWPKHHPQNTHKSLLLPSTRINTMSQERAR